MVWSLVVPGMVPACFANLSAHVLSGVLCDYHHSYHHCLSRLCYYFCIVTSFMRLALLLLLLLLSLLRFAVAVARAMAVALAGYGYGLLLLIVLCSNCCFYDC